MLGGGTGLESDQLAFSNSEKMLNVHLQVTQPQGISAERKFRRLFGEFDDESLAVLVVRVKT